MIELIISLLASILWLAAGIGVLISVILLVLMPLYEQWRFHKYRVDSESDTYKMICDAMDKAEGREMQINITIVEDEPDV